MADGEQVIREIWRRWNEGDREWDPAIVDPELEIRSMLTGRTYRGRSEVEQWMAEIDEQFEEWSLHIDGLDEVALQCLRCGGVQGWSKDAVLCPCGGGWEPAALPKRVLERFDLSEWLGAGGMGVVYRALDLTLGRDVSIGNRRLDEVD